MPDIDEMYEEVNAIWPNRRSAAEKAAEKEALLQSCKSDSSFQRLKTQIEILVADISPNRLPTLLSVITASKKFVTHAPIVSKATQVEVPDLPAAEDDDVVKTFKELFSAWPENDFPASEKSVKAVFQLAARSRPLEEIKEACSKYIQDMNDPRKASVHVLGMKRFLSDDDIFESWLLKATRKDSDYDTSYFDAVYSLYPDFAGKIDQTTIEESLGFYKRFVKPEEAVDFYCAVLSYVSSCKDRIRDEQARPDYVPAEENKYTKKFCNFVRVWRKTPRVEEMVGLLHGPMVRAMNNRSFPYLEVYPDGSFESALRYACSKFDDKGEYVSCCSVITNLLESMCKSLTLGKFPVRMPINVSLDYSMVSDVMGIIKNTARNKKC